MKLVAVIVVFLAVLTACSHSSENTAVAHRYPLTGRIVALNSQDRTAMVDAAAIPNFMEAMTMEYPVRSQLEFNSLHVGDHITATVNVRGEGGYYLSDIKIQKAVK